MPAGVKSLLYLWRGDEFSMGFQHAELAVEVCRHIRPKDAVSLRLWFYPGLAEEQVDPEALAILKRGFELWEKRGKPVLGAT